MHGWPSRPDIALVACAFLLIPAAAQSLRVLHSFDGAIGGRNPQAGLVAAGNTLYGAADSGGAGRSGTFFRLNKDGTGFATLHDFALLINETNADGAYPDSTPVRSGETVFGTAYDGGLHGFGTVFKLGINGGGFAVLHHFRAMAPNPAGASTNADGANPESGLVVADDVVYGTTENGGTAGLGAVFRVGADGTGFANLHSFVADEGDTPEALVLAGNQLFGTAAGLKSGGGCVFRLNLDGSGFAILRRFVAANYDPPRGGPGLAPAYTNADGALPSSLRVDGTTLYGTTYWGGSNGNGTVYRLQLDGSGFTVLHHFGGTKADPKGVFTNSGGAHPIQFSGLTLWGNTLFGSTFAGGRSGNGTLFALRTNGTGFTILHEFSATAGLNQVNGDGAAPYAGLLYSDGTLYGTARDGGTFGNGTLFSLAIQPRLSIVPAGENAILTWPQGAIGFALQSSTDLGNWTNVTPAPVVVNGFNTVIRPVSEERQFYRLTQ